MSTRWDLNSEITSAFQKSLEFTQGTSKVLRWLDIRKQSVEVLVEQIAIDDLDSGYLTSGTRRLAHKSGGFFQSKESK